MDNVIQADRDRAAGLLLESRVDIKLGLMDESKAVQAFAAHRIAGQAELRAALEAVRDGDVPRPIGEAWREDGTPSKLDRCTHGIMMREDCTQCVAAFIDAALQPLSQAGEERNG